MMSFIGIVRELLLTLKVCKVFFILWNFLLFCDMIDLKLEFPVVDLHKYGGAFMWLFFTLATTLLWGIAELFYKKGSHEDQKYDHLRVCVMVGLVMGIHAVYTLLTSDVAYDPVNLIMYLPVSMCYIVSMACSYFGIRFIEESLADPIENTAGAMCSLLCVIFLGESIAPMVWVAIAIITIGIIGVTRTEQSEEVNRSEKLGKKLALIAFAMPFCYAIIDAVGSFLDIFFLELETSPLIGVTAENIELVANISYELTFAIVGFVLFMFMMFKKVKFEWSKQQDKALAAVCETAGQLTYVYAMSGNGAIAAPILSSVCVVSLILSRIFLKEKLTKKQYVFISIIITGILMLAVLEGE